MEEYTYFYNWESQLSVNLAVLGSLTIVVGHHLNAIPPYNYISLDYSTDLSLFTHHIWIGGFCIVGAATHGSISIIRSIPTVGLVDRLLFHRDTILYQLNYVCLFLGFHSFGLYIHNDTLSALGTDSLLSDHSISLQPIFAQFVQHFLFENHNQILYVNESRIGIAPFVIGSSDCLVHHIHAFTIHVTTLILLKGVLFAQSSRLIADKYLLGFRFPCDGPGRGGTCQVSSWDHIFLGLFWMYNSLSIVIFHFSWK